MRAMNTSLPTLYISHGSPMTALEPREAGAFMQRLGVAIDKTFGRPKAILAICAHTLGRQPYLLAAAQHQAVYDFGGFPEELYRLQYNAPGAPELATRVQTLMTAAEQPLHRVEEGGLDHGIWTPLRYMYPQADVPVLPLPAPRRRRSKPSSPSSSTRRPRRRPRNSPSTPRTRAAKRSTK